MSVTALKTATKRSAPATIKANPLASSAMLVSLAVHRWGNRKTEVELNAKTAADVEAEADMFRTTKRLLGADSVRGMTSTVNRLKTHYYTNTLPWTDDGYRLLPAANYLKFIEEARKLKEDVLKAVDDFLVNYPTYREAARKRLGKAFSENDYPTPENLKKRWSVDLHFQPIPDKADFRIDLPAEELKKISADVDQHVAKAFEEAQQDLFQRLYEVVSNMRDKLSAYKVTRSKGKKSVENAFRDSLVEHVRKLVDLMPRLNFNNDPELTRLTNEVKKSLAPHDADDLREDDDLRAKTVKAADAILDKMKDYIGG